MAFDLHIYDRIALVNKPWMIGSDYYVNAKPGSEKMSYWVPGDGIAADGVRWDLPFHISTSGSQHTYFVLDFDARILGDLPAMDKHDQLILRESKIRVTLDFVKKWLEQNPEYQFFAKISGSGIHLVQKYDKRINPKRMEPVAKYLFPKCEHAPATAKPELTEPHICDENCDGWHNPYEYDKNMKIWKPWVTRWSKVVVVDGIKAEITVDLGMFYTRHMIRWTYSRNMKIPSRFNYAIPIDEWNADWILEHMHREKMIIHEYTIPPFQFERHLLPKGSVPGVPKPTHDEKYRDGKYYRIDVPAPEEELTQVMQYKIDQLDALMACDEKEVPPCVSIWYQKTKTEKGIFWGRFVWVRWLANKGYTPEEIGTLMRFKVNDELDNAPGNRKKLEQYMPQVYGPRAKPYSMMRCTKLQFHGEPTSAEWKIATEEMCAICKRTHPLQNYREHITEEEKEAEGFIEIQRKCMDILDNFRGQNLVVKKATRAGLTTTMIPMAKMLGRKMLVVVPTNKIGRETFVKAVSLCKTKFDVEVNGAMFAANKNACLILTILNEEVKRKKRTSADPVWAAPLAWSALRYHSKPTCEKCKYREMEFPIPIMNNDIPVPMIDADITVYQDSVKHSQGTCAYITLYNHIRDLDVVFITYSKLFALFSTDSDQASFIRNELFECFDVVLLDEVSHLTNHSAMTIKLLRKSASNNKKVTKYAEYADNLIFELHREIITLREYKDSKTTQSIEDYVMKFIFEYEHFLENPLIDEKTRRMDNFLDPDDIDRLNEHFSAYHDIIEKAALERNISFSNIEAILFLLKEQQWMMSSIPTNFNPIDMSLIVEPATRHIKNFIREVDRADDKQVIVTDATLPYVNMMDFFEIKFNHYEVGDPRGTNDTQLVITDSRNVNVIDLFFNKLKRSNLQMDLLRFISTVGDAHGAENIMVVAPNIFTFHWLYNMRKEGAIPKRLILTYYRSDLTIGVESDRRVMITICPPTPPKGSHDWLAFYFHLDGILIDLSIKELGRRLGTTSAKIAFYQAIGRSKDPEVRVKSVVYCWGVSGGRHRRDKMGIQSAMDLMTFDDEVPKPHIFNPTPSTARSDLVISVGKIWINSGTIVDPFLIRIAGIVRTSGSLTENTLRDKMRSYSNQLDGAFSSDSLALLEYLGVTVTETYSPQSRDRVQRLFQWSKYK